MAIDRDRAKRLMDDIGELFDSLARPLPTAVRDRLKRMLFGGAFDEIRQIICESRPPVLMVFGRTGHGKSSLINALAGKEVAAVGRVSPRTEQGFRYEIDFPGRYATWSVIDTRGIFESTPPEGAEHRSSEEVLIQGIRQYRPDVLFHVISAQEVSTLSNDTRVFERIQSEIKGKDGIEAPRVIVLTKVDTLGRAGCMPPEEHPRAAGAIVDAIDYVAEAVCHTRNATPIDPSARIRGVVIAEGIYEAVIPTCTFKDAEVNWHWNIETLSDFVGHRLPEDARLLFAQALGRKTELRRMSSGLIKRFAGIAGAIGADPIPVADIIVLTPLQILMIAVIGGLSCQEVSKKTARKYMSAAGLNVISAVGLRALAQQLVKLIPGVGSVVSAAIASGGTYAIGKSAEAWFFSQEKRSPEEFRGEWETEVEQ